MTTPALLPRRARALWFTAPGTAALREEPLPPLAPGQSLLRAVASAVSPGTERLVLAGQVPPAVREDMRVPYMGGDFAFPVKYGYSLVARVEASDDPALEGRLVHLLHPHQDRAVARNADLFVVDEAIDPVRAALAANLETAVNAVWDAEAALGERCLVVGFGIIGSLAARLLARIPGVEVVVAERDAAQAALAASLGFAACAPQEVAGEFDLAIDASASGEGLQLAIDRTGTEGRIVEASWHGTHEVRLALGGSFHRGRKRLLSTQVSSIPARHAPRWDHARRKRLVFALLRDAAFARHVTATVAFAELAAFVNGGALAQPGLARVVLYPTP